jgi:NAD(P)H-hydrate repair Nnr-like enzyme with NAD(P)H-hydrate dehydratase domain
VIRLALDKTMVIDGDGLFALGQDPELLLSLSDRHVLTPNVGEAERLETVMQSREVAGRELRAVVLRKVEKTFCLSLFVICFV